MRKILFIFCCLILNSFGANSQTGFFSSEIDSTSYIKELEQDSLYKDILRILEDCDRHQKCFKCDDILFYSTFLSKNYDSFTKEIYFLRYDEEKAFLYVFNATIDIDYEKGVKNSSIIFSCDKAKLHIITPIEKQHILTLIDRVETNKYYKQKFLKDGIIYNPHSFFSLMIRKQKKISLGVVSIGTIDIKTKNNDSNYPQEVIGEIYRLFLDF